MAKSSQDHDTGGVSQTVADPEEFNQQRRLRSIHDARDRARATYEATQDPGMNADYSTLAANYRATVQNYVGEIEGLLNRYDFDEGDIEDNYWTGVELGPLEITPPQKLFALRENREVSVIGNAELTSETYSIPGLEGYLKMAAQCPLTEEFALPVRQRHRGQETVSATVSMEMPIQVSYTAYRTANRFLTGVGFDVEIEAKEHRSEVTDEIIEEVEQWRQQNLNE